MRTPPTHSMRPRAARASLPPAFFFQAWVTLILYILMMLPVLKTVGAAVFLGLGLFYCIVARQKLISICLSSILVFLLPILALISTFWSIHPQATLRPAIQYLSTVMIIVVIARSIPLRQFVLALMLAGALAAICALILGFGEIRAGYNLDAGMGSKNIVAFNANVAILASIGVFADSAQGRAARFAAVPSIMLGIVALLFAHSAGALVSTLLSVALFLLFTIGRRLPPLLRGATWAAAIVIIPTIWFVVLNYGDEIFSDVLQSLGKDATLTGRTSLWQIALAKIAEHPALGLGYHAFWQQGSVDAEGIWQMMGIAARSGFNFHNQYLEVMVELGVTGLIAFCAMVIPGTISLVVKAVLSGEAAICCITSIFISLLVRSPIESLLSMEFSTFTALFAAACAIGLAPAGFAGRQERPAQHNSLSALHRRVRP